MSVESQLFLQSVALPAGVATAVSLLAIPAPPRLRPSLRAAAVALGFGVSYVVVSGCPGLPPRDVAGWLPWFAVAAVPVVAAGRRLTGWRQFGVSFAVAAACTWLLLHRLAERLWTTGEAALYFAGAGLGLLALWSGFAGAPGRRREAAVVALALAGFSAALCVFLAYSVRYASFGAAIAAATLPLVVHSLRRPGSIERDGLPAAWAFGGLLIVMWQFAEVRLGIVLALAASVVAAGVPRLPTSFCRTGRRELIARLAIAALCTSAAIALAIATRLAAPEDPYADWR